MNTIDEIIESYTYNGAVSLKALDDDIVTLKNQIQSDIDTLHELRLRNINTRQLKQKIVDEKNRLTVLQSVYKKVSDSDLNSNVSSSVLEISAKNEGETTQPQTAASNRKPLEQNFAKAEVEKTTDEEFSLIREEIPMPTIDDFMESDYVCDNTDLPEYIDIDMSESVIPDYKVTISSGNEDTNYYAVTVEEDETEYDESKAYDAFYSYDNKIYASFDLCPYTNTPNTDSVSGFFNPKYKTIELTFTDARDYPLLLFFLNEKNEKFSFFKRILNRFGKNQRSIIMYVRTELDGVKKEYRYEFTGCRLVSVFDSEYKSMRDSTYYGTSTHEFFTKFKYKKFKVV